jgi:hypothetical protein
VCVAVLIVNDHVLKHRVPAWWTGKLSDVAGVCVVGVLLSALIGPRRGLLATGVLFAALKTIPGVAELAAPLLGGTTLRDETDLIAVIALVPLWRLLVRARARRHYARERTAVAGVVPIVGAVLALAAATATSCSSSPAVTAVLVENETFFAMVEDPPDAPKWGRSDDGGRSWERTERPKSAPTLETADMYEDPGPIGPLAACVPDGTCWRLRDRRAIERGSLNGAWSEEVRLTDAELSNISTGCGGGSIGVLGSLGVVERGDEPQVVASLGAEGVLVRQGDSTWERVGVLSAFNRDLNGLEDITLVGAMISGPVLLLVVWLVGRRRWPSWHSGMAVAAVGWGATAAVVIAVGMFAGQADSDISGAVLPAGWAGITITTIASIVVARRTARRVARAG